MEDQDVDGVYTDTDMGACFGFGCLRIEVSDNETSRSTKKSRD
jgi:hypothetical protein